MKDTAIIKKARDAGRAALDEENGKKLLSEYGISVIENPKPNNYHAVIVTVNHDQYRNLCEDDFRKLLVDGEGVLIDVKGIFYNKIKNLDYWSL